MSDRNLAKLKFIGFFVSAVVLCVVILSSFWKPQSVTPSQEQSEAASNDKPGAQQLLSIDQLLHTKWTQLELMYSEYALTLTDPLKKDKNNVDSRQVMEAEVLYAKILDSVSANNSSSPIVKEIDSTVNSFRATLQNRQTLNSKISDIALRNAGKAGSVIADGNNQNQQINDLKNDLISKNGIISKLQTEVSTTAALKNNLNINEQKVLQMQKDIQAKTEMMAKLQSQVNASSLKNNGTVASEQKVRQLQMEVQSKTETIAILQSQLKTAPVKNNTSGNEQQLRTLQKELDAKSFMIVKLQSQLKSAPTTAPANSSQSSATDLKKITDELEFLKWALRSEVSSNHALTSNVNQLKQANASLLNQLKGK